MKFLTLFFANKKKDTINYLNYQYDVKDYDNLYNLSLVACKISGLRLKCEDTAYVRMFWQMYYWWYFITCFLGALLESVNMVLTYRSGNSQDIFLMIPCVGFVLGALAKSYNISMQRPIFENLISELRSMWPRGNISQEEHEILSPMIKQIRFIVKAYFWCNVFLIFSFTSPPFFQYAKRLMGYDVPLILSFQYWLPFDEFSPIYYETVVITQTLETISVVFFMVAADLLLFTFLSNITAQFNILAVKIRRMIFVPIDEQLIEEYPLGLYNKEFITKFESKLNGITFEEWEGIHMNEIRYFALRHRDLIRLATDVENMYNFSLLINFINSSVIICFCGYCCVFVEKWNDLIYKFFLISAISQVWMLCWYGQSLLNSSEKVAHALYSSGWYMASKKIKKSILIILHRSQKNVHLTTYGFSIVSLETFTTIIKTSWSYFTLLINAYQR